MASQNSPKGTVVSPSDDSSTVLAESAAVLTGSLLTGNMMSISILSIPMLLDTCTTASQLVNQWRSVYNYGASIAPGIGMATALLYGNIIYKKRARGKPWRVFAAAAGLTLTMIPFTFICILPTNKQLFAADDLFKAGKAAMGMVQAQEIVKIWNKLHIARTMFPLVGTCLGLLGSRGALVF